MNWMLEWSGADCFFSTCVFLIDLLLVCEAYDFVEYFAGVGRVSAAMRQAVAST